PYDLNRIRNINFRRMRTDEAYQAQFADLVLRFLNAMGIGTVGATEIDMSVHSEEEKTYQNYISKMFKNTLIDIYNNRSQMWDNNEETGKKRIGERDPFIYMALINYVQYKELLSDIECHAHFAKLPQYNDRREPY